jgi:hypothetical protein
MTTSPMERYASADRPASSTSDPWILERVAAGWHPQAIATAAGVSLRTAQRWRSQVLRIEEVELGGYVARFAICRTRPPFRLEPWRRP